MDTNTAWETLRDFAEGRIEHINAGSCPDCIEGFGQRDIQCPVCRALDATQDCLAQIEEPAQPVAEICSASHDDAQFGERAIKLLRDISGFDYGTQLYAGAAPAAVAPALDVTLDEDQAGLLRDMLGDPAEYEEALNVRLIVCDGHSGHGLYVAQAEYQDEGAVLLTALEAPAAQDLPADEFRGDTPSLVRNIIALLQLDAEGALVPHGVGGHARGLLSAAAARLAAAPQAPNCTRCSGSGEDPEGYLTHGRGPDDHTVDGPCRECDGTGAAPQAPAAPAVDALSQAVRDVLAERQRQAEAEGYDTEHDDAHVMGEIGALAALYLMPDGARDWDATSTTYGTTLGQALLPEDWTMPTMGEDRRRDLVKGVACGLAELERWDRASAQTNGGSAA